MDMKQIKELTSHLEKSKLKKILYKTKDFELHLEKEDEIVASPQRKMVFAEEAQPPPPPEKQKPKEMDAPGSFVTSPMVGTYYASPSPDQPHFVKVGDSVREGTVLCIIEAMKVMNEVKAKTSGKVAEILAHNGQPVEFGTRLFRITSA